jgi:hypothetical protein
VVVVRQGGLVLASIGLNFLLFKEAYF